MKTKMLTSLAAALTLGLAAAVPAEDDAAIIAAQRPSYPLTRCVVTNANFDETRGPVAFVHEGRLFLLATEGAKQKIQAHPEIYTERLDAAVVERQTPIYPLETCVVSGEKLGSMGDPVDVVHGTRLARLCCKGCLKTFRAKPDGFMAKIDAALIERQRADYPLDKCLVSDEKLGSMGEPIERLYGITLVRLCCKGCVKSFEKDPDKFVMQIWQARAEARKADARQG